MEVKIKNLGILDEGLLDVKENVLNIKYGLNGIGKSTVARALKIANANGDLTNMAKYGTAIIPTVQVSQSFDDVAIFNDEYIEEYLFKEDLANNSYEIFVNTNEYRSAVAELDAKFDKLLGYISSANLNEIIDRYSVFINAIGVKASGTEISRSSKIYKSMNAVSVSNHLDETTSRYEPYLADANSNKWLGWFRDGKNYIHDNMCPFCIRQLPDSYNTSSTALLKIIKETDLKNRIEMSGVISNVKKYVSVEDAHTITEIFKDGIIEKNEQNKLIKIRGNTEFEKNKLETLSRLNRKVVKDYFEREELDSFLDNLKINLDSFVQIRDEEREKLKKINDEIDNIINDTNNLNRITSNFAHKINYIIKRYEDKINEFLTMAGIPYEVEINYVDSEKCLTRIKPKNTNISIENKEYALSYGEKNTISLFLFALDAVQKNKLIILDDPVSSFDNNKKYAIYYYLFAGSDAILKGKTVILFTHYFDLIIDFTFNNALANCCRESCAYLENKNGVLKENGISKDHITSTLEYWKSEAKNVEKSKAIRLANLRRYQEYADPDKCDAYNMLSSLEKLRACPTNGKVRNTERMNDNEMESANEYIKKIADDFEYTKWLEELDDEDNIISWYERAESGVEKLQIARLFLNKTSTKPHNKILNSYITEVYHVENNEMMMLPQKDYETIPKYILDICDGLLEKTL